MHGSRLSSAQWSPQLPLLRPEVAVSLVDLPGHGTRVDEVFTLDRCVEVVDEAVRAAPTGDRVILVGHSLGGYAAMTYAAAQRPRRPQVRGRPSTVGSPGSPTGWDPRE